MASQAPEKVGVTLAWPVDTYQTPQATYRQGELVEMPVEQANALIVAARAEGVTFTRSDGEDPA